MRLPKSLTRLVEEGFNKFKLNPMSYRNGIYTISGVSLEQAKELEKRYFSGHNVDFEKVINNSGKIVKDKYHVNVSMIRGNKNA
jgi:hypothetical protein